MLKVKPPEKILMVDDEQRVLDSFRRELRGKINMETALGGDDALQKINQNGPYAVVITDLKMPGMDGNQLLTQVMKISPDTVRMMLTGYAEVENTIKAVNEGNVFRFLTKPCETDTLARALVDGIRQYRLVRAEKDLLDKTLRGAIKLFTDVLALLKPQALGRATRITPYIKGICEALGIENDWQYETAAMLSQIGCITLPDLIVGKAHRGEPMGQREKEVFLEHPQLGYELVSGIPRMEGIAQIIAYQEKHFDGGGVPRDESSEEDIPLGARILKVILDFDALVSAGMSKGRAFEAIKANQGFYDPAIITAMSISLGVEAKYDIEELNVYDLKEGMIVHEDVVSFEGTKKILGAGQELSQTLVMSLRSYNRIMGVREPIKVKIPIKT